MHARVMAFAKCRCGHLSATIEMRVCATPRGEGAPLALAAALHSAHLVHACS